MISSSPRYSFNTSPLRLLDSEGFFNRCSFCIIPTLRGDLTLRPISDVLREAEKLVQAGVKELLVISQDTSTYDIDLKYLENSWKDRIIKTKFFDLCRELGNMGIRIRMHYVYPYPHVDEVIELMAAKKFSLIWIFLFSMHHQLFGVI